jgi:hypothetical protein
VKNIMKLTIIKDMGLVHVDGSGFGDLDMSSVPSNVHALHWDSDNSLGEIEHTDNTNESITVLPSWANTVKGLHDDAQALVDQEIADAEAYSNSDEGKAEAIRVERDEKLKETDWWALSDNTMTQAQEDYRQALRDVTDQSTFPDSVTWPTKP